MLSWPTDRLQRPVDISSIVALRVLYGLMAAFASVRFLLNGWVERFFLKPSYHFHYWGFEGVEVLPSWAMHGAFVIMALLGVAIALGAWTRAACVLFVAIFSYVELIDVALYLNHYYLFSLLGLLLALSPADRAYSIDAWRRPDRAVSLVPFWRLGLLRFQVACVYVFAGLAKAGPDWLLDAQPLNIWLNSRVETPLIGSLFAYWEVALLMSWGGFLFDSTIVIWLLWSRSRPLAYVVVLCFHLMTHMLFNIGMFPLIMICAATIFFDPRWGRRWLPQRLAPPAERSLARLPARWRAPVAVLVCAYMLFHLLMPLRCHLYGGNVLWHEQGMRWSWRVMVREKNGAVSFHVREPDGRRRLVKPSRYLNDHQEREMAGQPDLILQLAHHIGEEYSAICRGKGRCTADQQVEVRVDTRISLNGRRSQPMIDPHVDLMRIRDGLAPATWILPAPTSDPPHLAPR